MEEACGEVLRQLGVVTVLVNNGPCFYTHVWKLAAAQTHTHARTHIHTRTAGLLSNHNCLETSLAEWHRVFRVNVDGALLLAQQVLPGMVRAYV